MSRFRPHLRAHDLTEQQWRVIRALSEYGELEVSQLAERSLLLGPSLTRILRHLVESGLVGRTLDTQDQRRSIISLTSRGVRLFKKVATESEALYAKMSSEFGEANMQKLYSLLYDFWDTMDHSES